ncbi:hypothetical protein Z949_3323 [Sulfitobacter guttiformis KCTC 32187]|nr:hypothetical protein Z949_3323 [Sulfitobacter guttiformis KCTC 32187]
MLGYKRNGINSGINIYVNPKYGAGLNICANRAVKGCYSSISGWFPVNTENNIIVSNSGVSRLLGSGIFCAPLRKLRFLIGQ